MSLNLKYNDVKKSVTFVLNVPEYIKSKQFVRNLICETVLALSDLLIHIV